MHILVALLIMVMMSTAILGNLMLGGIKIYALSLVFMAIIAFFELLKNRDRYILDTLNGENSKIYLILLYVLFCASSLLWTDSKFDSFESIKKLVIVSSLVVSLPILIKGNLVSMKSISYISFLSLAFICSVVFYYVYKFGVDNAYNIFKTGDVQSGNSIFTWYVVSVFGESVFGNSQNIVAGYAVTIYGLFLVCSDRQSEKIKIIDIVAAVLICLILLLSLSKSAFIGFSVILTALYINKHSRFNAAALTMILFLLVFQPFFPFKEGLLARFGVLQTQLSSIASTSRVEVKPEIEVKPDTAVDSRKQLWGAAIELFRSSPWIGHGYGGSRAVYQRTVSDGVNNPHNMILQSLADLGMIGTLFMLLALSNVMALAYSLFKITPSVSILLSAIIVG